MSPQVRPVDDFVDLRGPVVAVPVLGSDKDHGLSDSEPRFEVFKGSKGLGFGV